MLNTTSSPEKEKSTPKTTAPKENSNAGLVVFIVFLIVAVCGFLGFLLYKNYVNKQQTTAVNSSTAPKPVNSGTTSPANSQIAFTPNTSAQSSQQAVTQGAASWRVGMSSLFDYGTGTTSNITSQAQCDPLNEEPSDMANRLNGISALVYKKQLTADLVEQYKIEPKYYQNVMSSSVNGLGMGVPYVAYIHEDGFDDKNHIVRATIDSIRYLIRYLIDSKERIVGLEIAGRW